MYYKIDNRIYTKEEISGKTFDGTNKPEPLFTLEEARFLFSYGYSNGQNNDEVSFNKVRDIVFKQTFNITI